MKEKLFRVVINGISSSVFIPRKIRFLMIKAFNVNIRSTHIAPGVFFYSSKINIGTRSLINREAHIYNYANVTLEDDVFLAPQTMLCTVTHEIGESSRRAGELKALPITIKKGSWIGARATIMPGVTVGEGCIIAAGSMVTKDCKPNGVYAGVPAKRVKELDCHIKNDRAEVV